MLWLALAVAAAMALFLWKARRNYEALPELDAAAAPAGVTVIIPARNEASSIERCVSSFTCPVIVVDDGSTDGTAELAAAAGARVISAPPLEPGVLGKPNACAAGARASDSCWLLFVDADTWYAPDFAGRAVGYAERESLDVLTAFLRQERRSWAERVILPYAFALYFCGVNARRVNSPDGEALANGQCLLVRREAYLRMGGHDAVKNSVIEDVAFAQLAKRHGFRLRVVRAEKWGSVRMYDGFRSIWRGFEKNSFRFLQANPWTGVQVVAASMLMTAWLPLIVIMPLAAVVVVVGMLPWYGSLREALLAPLGVYLFQAIALAGMFKTLAGVKSVWKGRRV